MTKQLEIPILVELSCQQETPGNSTSVKYSMLDSAKGRKKVKWRKGNRRAVGLGLLFRSVGQRDLTEKMTLA